MEFCSRTYCTCTGICHLLAIVYVFPPNSYWHLIHLSMINTQQCLPSSLSTPHPPTWRFSTSCYCLLWTLSSCRNPLLCHGVSSHCPHEARHRPTSVFLYLPFSHCLKCFFSFLLFYYNPYIKVRINVMSFSILAWPWKPTIISASSATVGVYTSSLTVFIICMIYYLFRNFIFPTQL